MCLVINKKVRNNNHKEDGYCVGYKSIYKDSNESIYRDHIYRIGENKSDRGDNTLTQSETLYLTVHYGFHLFLHLRDAKDKTLGYSQRKIIKVFYKPEDVVAYGNWEEERGSPNVVVTKVLVKSLNDIKGESHVFSN